MAIDARIPEFTDKELENLNGNAARLAHSGTPAQRAEAERLMPLIAIELETRVKAKAIAQREKLEEASKKRNAKRLATKAAKESA